MTWSYSGIPSTSLKDEVRFWCQDVVEARPYLTDEEIEYLLDKWYDQTASVILVASVACEVIAAKLAAEVNVSADGVSVSTSELMQKYITLAQRLRDQAKMELDDEIEYSNDELWTPGLSSDIAPLVFGIGFHDNWEAGRQDYGGYHPGRHGAAIPDPLAPAESEK